MIAGDPDRFAVKFQVVDAWNVQGDSWRNGVLYVYAGGVRIFDAVEALELRSALSFFSGIRLPDSTTNVMYEDREVFDNARAYFSGALGDLLPGIADFSATEAEDSGFMRYFKMERDGDRLVWSRDDGHTVEGIKLETGTVAAVIEQLKTCRL
ncbi:Imm42 family immunity protein [Pseudomonas soli]|uniref:Imm42 family immunity protein n=1 Tax=Pseudomonas soli TaxID=1306993 RepID=UPI003DA98915